MTVTELWYRFAFPVRFARQRRLRSQRRGRGVDDFLRELELTEDQLPVAHAAWSALQTCALVDDFVPGAGDDLLDIYALAGEELVEELIEPMLAQLGLASRLGDLSAGQFNQMRQVRDVVFWVVELTRSP